MAIHKRVGRKSKVKVSWDPECEDEFVSWLRPPPLPSDSDLRICAFLRTRLLAYQDSPLVKNDGDPPIVRRRDNKLVRMYGFVYKLNYALGIGICGNEIRVVVLGPCDRHDFWKICEQRIQRW